MRRRKEGGKQGEGEEERKGEEEGKKGKEDKGVLGKKSMQRREVIVTVLFVFSPNQTFNS